MNSSCSLITAREISFVMSRDHSVTEDVQSVRRLLTCSEMRTFEPFFGVVAYLTGDLISCYTLEVNYIMCLGWGGGVVRSCPPKLTVLLSIPIFNAQ